VSYIKVTFENNVFIALNNLSYTFKILKNVLPGSMPQYCPLYRVLSGTEKKQVYPPEKTGDWFYVPTLP